MQFPLRIGLSGHNPPVVQGRSVCWPFMNPVKEVVGSGALATFFLASFWGEASLAFIRFPKGHMTFKQ